MRRSLLTLVLMATALCLHAQTDIPGCTNPGALNYNPGRDGGRRHVFGGGVS